MIIQDENYSVKRSYSAYNDKIIDGELAYKTGRYVCEHGIVSVYAQDKNESYKSSMALIRLDFVYKGRVYYRTIWKVKSITDRSCTIRAAKFVKHIVNLKQY